MTVTSLFTDVAGDVPFLTKVHTCTLMHTHMQIYICTMYTCACIHVHTHAHTAHKHVQKGIPDPAPSASQNEFHSTDAALEGGG